MPGTGKRLSPVIHPTRAFSLAGEAGRKQFPCVLHAEENRAGSRQSVLGPGDCWRLSWSGRASLGRWHLSLDEKEPAFPGCEGEGIPGRGTTVQRTWGRTGSEACVLEARGGEGVGRGRTDCAGPLGYESFSGGEAPLQADRDAGAQGAGSKLAPSRIPWPPDTYRPPRALERGGVGRLPLPALAVGRGSCGVNVVSVVGTCAGDPTAPLQPAM